MNIYVITSKVNLQKFNEVISSKYSSVTVQGTNDLLEGIETVMSRHIIEEYDLFLVLNQRFAEEDLASQQKISKRFNEACAYALKDLPIYFLCKEGNKSLETAIKTRLKTGNIKLYPYKNLNVSVIEEIMKEVLVHIESKKDDLSSIRKDVIKAKKIKQQKQIETGIDRIFDERKKRDTEDFKSLSRIQNIINQYSSKVRPMDDEGKVDKSSQILQDLKTQLFSDAPKFDVAPLEPIEIKGLNHTVLDEKISPQRLQEDLMQTNQQYKDYSDYITTIKGIINEIKESDEPNKHEMIYDLIREKARANNEKYTILSEFLTEVVKTSIDYVSDEYRKEINELHEFGEMQDVDSLIGKEMSSIDELKQKRETMKSQVKYMVESLATATKIVSKQLTDAGNLYLLEYKEIEKEIKEYANEHNLPLNQANLPSPKPIINSLKVNYGQIKQVTNELIVTAQKTVKNMLELVTVDDQIIEKQDGVIDTLMTQKTKKIITVDNFLQTKLNVFIGPDGAGKTHTAVNMAYCHSKLRKTLLVDLNIYNPNLVYYNRDEDLNKRNSEWLNNQTIPMEEFINIPIGRYMHEQLPFKDNLTIIQPMDKIDLDYYERTVSPSVFSLHIKNFLDELSQFYDIILVILPEDLREFQDLLSFVGVMYLVNDFNAINFNRSKDIMRFNNEKLERVPVKHLIINKHHRGIKLSHKDYLEACEIDTREFKYTIVSEFKDSVQDKLDGNIPVMTNINLRKVFDDIIKR